MSTKRNKKTPDPTDDEQEEGGGAWVINPDDQVQQHEGTTFEENEE